MKTKKKLPAAQLAEDINETPVHTKRIRLSEEAIKYLDETKRKKVTGEALRRMISE